MFDLGRRKWSQSFPEVEGLGDGRPRREGVHPGPSASLLPLPPVVMGRRVVGLGWTCELWALGVATEGHQCDVVVLLASVGVLFDVREHGLTEFFGIAKIS